MLLSEGRKLVRNLSEIIEECKTNGRPEYDELRYSVIALVSMLNMDHKNLHEELMREKPLSDFLKKMKSDNSHNMYRNALNKSPKDWLGWNNDPENPDYQKFHAMGTKLIEKALAGELPNQKISF